MILFCQMDVTGRTENDAAAEILQHGIGFRGERRASARQRQPSRALEALEVAAEQAHGLGVGRGLEDHQRPAVKQG